MRCIYVSKSLEWRFCFEMRNLLLLAQHQAALRKPRARKDSACRTLQAEAARRLRFLQLNTRWLTLAEKIPRTSRNA